MEKETISLKKLYELIDEYKTVSVVGESVQIISTPVNNGEKRELTVRLEGSTTSSQKIFVFDDSNLFDKAILPSIISYVSGSKGFDGFDVRQEKVALYNTEDGIDVLVNSNDPSLFDVIENSCTLISNKTQYKNIDKNDNYYMWNNILRYVNGRMYHIDSNGIGLTDDDKEKLLELVKIISEDNFDKDKHVYTTSLAQTVEKVKALLEDKDKLTRLGFDPEFLNQLKQNMTIKVLSKLVINERKFSNYLNKRSDKEEVLSRVEFAKSQLNGMKADYFKCKDRVAAISGLMADYKSSDAYVAEQKENYMRYCEELLSFMGVVNADSNIIAVSPINVEEALAVTIREYDYFNDYEDMLTVYENLRDTLIENEKLDIRFMESSEADKVLIRLSTYNTKISDVKRESYVFAFDKSYFDRELLRIMFEKEKAAESVVTEEKTVKKEIKYEYLDRYDLLEFAVTNAADKTAIGSSEWLNILDIDTKVSPDRSKYFIIVNNSVTNTSDVFAFSAETFNGKQIRTLFGDTISEYLGITDNGILPLSLGKTRFEEKFDAVDDYLAISKFFMDNSVPDLDIATTTTLDNSKYIIKIKSEKEEKTFAFSVATFNGKQIREALGSTISNYLGIGETAIIPQSNGADADLNYDYLDGYDSFIEYFKTNSLANLDIDTAVSKDNSKYLIKIKGEKEEKTFAFSADRFNGRAIKSVFGETISVYLGITDNKIIPPEHEEIKYPAFKVKYEEMSKQPGFRVKVLNIKSEESYYIELSDNESEPCVYEFKTKDFKGKELISILGQDLANELGIGETGIVIKQQKTVTEEYGQYSDFVDYLRTRSIEDLDFTTALNAEKDHYLIKVLTKAEEKTFSYPVATFNGTPFRRFLGDTICDHLGINEKGINIEPQKGIIKPVYVNNYDYFRSMYYTASKDDEYDIKIVDGEDKDKYYIQIDGNDLHDVFAFDIATFKGNVIKSIIGKEDAKSLGILDDAIIPGDLLQKMKTARENGYVTFDADYLIFSKYPDFNVELLRSYDDDKIFVRMSGSGNEDIFAFDTLSFESDKLRRTLGDETFERIGLSAFVKKQTLDDKWFDIYKSLWENYGLADVDGVVKVIDRNTQKPVNVMFSVKDAITIANIWGSVVGFENESGDETKYRDLFTAFDNLMLTETMYTEDTFARVKSLFTFYLNEEGSKKYDELFGKPSFKEYVTKYYSLGAPSHHNMEYRYSNYRANLSDVLRDTSDYSYWNDYNSLRLFPGIDRTVDNMNQDLFDSLCNMIFTRMYSTNDDEKTETVNIYRITFEDRSALIRQYDKKYLKENFLDDHCTLPLGFVSPFARQILEMPPENLSEKGRQYAEYLDLSLVREIGQLSPEENKRYARLVINNPYAQLTEYVKTAACSGALGNNTASLIEMEIHNQLVDKVAQAEVNDVLKYLLLVEKSRRVGLTDAENETIDKYENSNEFFANLSSKISDDYQMLNNIEFDEIVYDYSNKFNGTEKMQEITNKFALDESGNIVEKKTGNYFTPRSAKEEATMTFSCIWFNSIDNNMDIDNNRLIQLFISYAEHSAGKEQNFEVFRRLVRDAGLNIGNNELMKIQTIAEPLRDIALGMKGYSEYEKEHGRVYVDLEKLAGICGIESDDADYYDMRMRKLIDYKFPERYQKSTAYYDRYATTMCNTLSGIMGGIKTQVMDGAEAIDTREIIKKFPRCSKERKYAKRLLATDEDVQVVCDVTVNKLHLDYKSANVITPISVEQAIEGPRLSA